MSANLFINARASFRYLARVLPVMLLLAWLPHLSLVAQSVSNAGTEFWTVFPTHEPDGNNLATLSVFITGNAASSGKITAGSFSAAFSVTPNAVTEIQIPRAQAYISDTEGNAVLSNRAVHILVDPDKPKVVVYSHIFAGRRSAASLILPSEALGQQYYSMNYTQDDAGQNYITVVATQPHTQLHFKKGNTELIPGGITLNNVNDVYEYLSPDDLTGVSISVDSLTSACNRFAAFSGSTGLRIGTPGCDPQSIDPLFQQVYPISSWGQVYAFVPFSTQSPNSAAPVRTAGQYVRILARENNTQVSIDGLTVATLNAGQFYAPLKPLSVTCTITGDKPVSVAQYALTQSCSSLSANSNSLSDPDMVILNPVEYNVNHITVYSSVKENISEQYLNIVLKTTAAPSFRINNQVPLAAFSPMNGLPGYSYLQLSLNKLGTNTFNLSAGEGFNALAYGFGNVESYAYSAGTNLAANASVNAIRTATGAAVDSTCVNDAYFFRLSLPYLSPRISWQLDAAETPLIQNNPTASTLTIQGMRYYQYDFPKTAAYNNLGRHRISIQAEYPASLGGCPAGGQQINSSFTVIPQPVVNFSYQVEKCHNMIDFTDLTSANTVNNIVSRYWDFGDGSGSAQANPIHAYADSGTYIVRLSVSFTTGCQDQKTDTIRIRQKLRMGFSVSAPDCVSQLISLSDTSTTTDFKVAARQWDFGDGDSVLVNTGALAQHAYAKPGKYTVGLKLISADGCMSAPFSKTVSVYPLPLPAFQLPAVCLTDQIAQFRNQTTIADSAAGPLTYLWDFGDPNATPANPNTSTLSNPVHRYTAALHYQVRLTVISTQGCPASIIKSFTVNGASPVASFQLNSSRICASEPVLVQNMSSVNFGSVTKIEWHFDELNHPDSVQVYINPLPGQVFSHHYPLFHSPASRTYTIRLIAYSGTQCFADTLKTITVMAAPQTAMDTIPPVCLSGAGFKLVQGHELSGIPGKGSYSGKGVSAEGIFDPGKAGTGLHIIQYRYLSDYGCKDSSATSIRVLADPKVNAGTDLRIMQGDAVQLFPQYSGDRLTYQWTPATGLNHADIPSPVAAPDKDITYTVTVSNGICEASDQVHITVIPPLEIPNTFTPNGDNVNDVWNIKNLSYYYPGATVEIFTKYGRKIFSSVGYGIPWDGKYNGHPMPPDTYYYIIDLNNGQKRLASWLQLLK